MTDPHDWMEGLRGVSLCRKCGKFTLRRSSRYGMIGYFRTKYSARRLYRCKGCGWNGWLLDSELRYPTMKDLYYLETGESVRRPGVSQAMKEVEQQHDGEPREESGTDPGDTTVGIPIAHGKRDQRESEGDTDSYLEFSFPKDEKLAEHVRDQRGVHPRKGMRQCPKCGNLALYRSHTRSFLEEIKKKITRRRPYRCNKCQWRGWLVKD